jgi:hypothetical protein
MDGGDDGAGMKNVDLPRPELDRAASAGNGYDSHGPVCKQSHRNAC